MRVLYNQSAIAWFSPETLRKLVGLGVILVAAIGSLSCRRTEVVAPNSATAKPAARAIADADELYRGRADLLKVREGIVALRQAQADDAANYDLAWRLAKFNYYLGAHSPNSTEQDKAFHEGIDAGKLAVQLQPNKPEGHFWLGANYGGNAEISTLAGLADIDEIKREMETVLKMDEGFQSGSAYMVLGQVYLESPRLLGGDTQKAIGYFEKGIKFGPVNALLRVRLAEAYAQDHQNGAAQKQIDALMSMKPTAGYEPEYNEAVADARKLQDKIK